MEAVEHAPSGGTSESTAGAAWAGGDLIPGLQALVLGGRDALNRLELQMVGDRAQARSLQRAHAVPARVRGRRQRPCHPGRRRARPAPAHQGGPGHGRTGPDAPPL